MCSKFKSMYDGHYLPRDNSQESINVIVVDFKKNYWQNFSLSLILIKSKVEHA